MTTEVGRPGRSIDNVIQWVVAGIAVVAGLAVMAPYAVGVFHDDGAYAILARAVAEGRGFHFLHLPGEPVAIHYPPGYPLLLGMVWYMVPGFPANIPALLAPNALFLGSAAWGTYALATRWLGWERGWAAAAALVGTVTFPLLLLAGILVSEPMFIAALVWTLMIAESMLSLERPRWHFVVFGLACGGLALVRTHGLALPASAILLLATRHRWREAALCVAGVAIAIAPWQLWQSLNAADLPGALRGSYGSYIGWFIEGLGTDGFIPRTLATNSRELWSLIAGRFAPGDHPWVSAPVPLLVLGLMVVGAWRLRSRAPVMVGFVLIYLAIVAVWPYTPWRFVFAVWPILVLLMIEAARAGVTLARARDARGFALVAVAGAVFAGMFVREARSFRDRAWATPAQVATRQTLPSLFWILANTRTTDVVASEVSELVFLYTGRKSVPVMPFRAGEYGVARGVALDGLGLREVVDSLPVDLVVTISGELRRAASTAASAGGARLVLVDTVGGGAAFRVIR